MTDSAVITSENYSQVLAGNLRITPPGGAQQTLGAALGTALTPLPMPNVPRSTVIPALHLPNLKASATPTIGIIGDSTSTLAANNLIATDMLWYDIIRRIREDNPGKVINGGDSSVGNYAIGGTAWSSFLTAPTVGWPAWYFNHAIPWFLYVQAAGITTLFINWGINDTFVLQPSLMAAVLANIVSWGTAPPAQAASTAYALFAVALDSGGRMVVATTAGTSGASAPSWATTLAGTTTDGGVVWTLMQTTAYVAAIPDIVLITNKTANVAAGVPYSQSNYQAGYLGAAAIQRTTALSGWNLGIAGLPPLGLIDIGRFFNQAVNGFDPAEKYFVQTVTTPITGISSFPFIAAPSSGDFDMLWTLPGAGQSAAGTVSVFGIGASDGTSQGFAFNQITLQTGTGNDIALYYYPGGLAPVGKYVATGWLATGQNLVRITAKGAHLYVSCNGIVLMDRLMPRFSSPSSPFYTVVNPPAGYAVTLNSYNTSIDRPYAKLLTPAAAYGTAGGLDGNGINHDASQALNLVDQHVLDCTHFA